jgi:hypothetical protein
MGVNRANLTMLPFQQPDRGARCEHDQEPDDYDDGAVPVVLEERSDHHDQAGQRPDGQVDAPGQDHAFLPERDERGRRDQHGERAEVEVGQEPDVVHLGVDGQGHDGQGQHAGRGVVAAGGFAQPGSGCALCRRPVRLAAAAGRGQHGVRDGVLGDLLAAEFGHHLAGGEDQHPVAEPFQLPGIGGDDDHAGPSVGGLAQDAVDLGPGADVDALGRLLGQQQRRLLVQQRPGQQHLLLVAAGQAEHIGFNGRCLDRQVLALGLGGPGLGARPDDPPAAELAERGDHGVLPHRERAEQALAEPVGGQVDHARIQRGGRTVCLERRPAQYGPAGRVLEPGQGAQELGLAVADDAGQADDLPGVRGQRHVVEGPVGQVLDDQRGIVSDGLRLGRELGGHRPADDELEQPGVFDVADSEAAADCAVAEHRDLLAQFAHLGQPVGDVHHGHPGGGQPAQLGEQGSGLLGAERGGGSSRISTDGSAASDLATSSSWRWTTLRLPTRWPSAAVQPTRASWDLAQPSAPCPPCPSWLSWLSWPTWPAARSWSGSHMAMFSRRNWS